MDQNQAITELPGERLVDSINKKLEALPSLSKECCIYKAPERLRILNQDAYTPRVVSIGPFHHGGKGLKAMEDHKLRYLECLRHKMSLNLEGMVEVAKTWEAKARTCYAEDIEPNSNEFVNMLIVDAAFLVELLLRSPVKKEDRVLDRIYGKQKMIVDVNHDIMLLENQLPYFVVEGMFELLRVEHRGDLPLPQMIHRHFGQFWMSIPSFSRSISDPETCHFVGLLRSFHLPSVLDFPRGITNKSMMDSTLSAKKIHSAGVKLKPAEKNTCPLDITFADGVLTIPRIKISDITEALYRNIILFEQCHLLETFFSDYMMFLSCFVRSPSNAELFIDHGIIVNKRGHAKDISRLFDRVLKETTQTSYSASYYQTINDKLEAYCNTIWHKSMATLSRDYFHTPWSALSVGAAIFLLFLTFIQALCSYLAL